MKHNFKQLIKKVPFPLILIFIILAPFYLILGCPIQFFTGISCMGCGMSRAAVALLQLDFSLALHMHPLIFVMPIAALIIIFRKKIPKNVMITLCVIGAVLMIGTYIYRIVTGSDVIYIEPENGFFYKIITYIFNNI